MQRRTVNKDRDSRRGWLGWGLLPVAGLLAVLVALLAITLPVGGDGDVAVADLDPNECDPSIGTATAIIVASPSDPAVIPGDTITYTVGAAYRNITGDACSAFNINVHLRTPDGHWAPICV